MRNLLVISDSSIKFYLIVFVGNILAASGALGLPRISSRVLNKYHWSFSNHRIQALHSSDFVRLVVFCN